MRPTVIKVGGGIAAAPADLEAVCAAIAEATGRFPMLVVPGGGPLADSVRELDRRLGLSPGAAHWMAILAMDQYAHLLAERIAGATLVEGPGAATEALRAGRVTVLAPSRWLRAADPLPHRWEVTSDSIAAFIAGALDAARLVLVKPVTYAVNALDSFFPAALPEGLPYMVVGCDQLSLLRELLKEADG